MQLSRLNQHNHKHYGFNEKRSMRSLIFPSAFLLRMTLVGTAVIRCKVKFWKKYLLTDHPTAFFVSILTGLISRRRPMFCNATNLCTSLPFAPTLSRCIHSGCCDCLGFTCFLSLFKPFKIHGLVSRRSQSSAADHPTARWVGGYSPSLQCPPFLDPRVGEMGGGGSKGGHWTVPSIRIRPLQARQTSPCFAD